MKIILILMLLLIILLSGCIEYNSEDVVNRLNFVDCNSEGARQLYHIDYEECRRVCCSSNYMSRDTCDSECMYDCNEELDKFKEAGFCVEVRG